jgi:transposase
MEEVRWFVGIDWGATHHQVCVLDEKRKEVENKSVAHDGAAMSALVERLMILAEGKSERLAVGIETRWNAIVDTLLERGIRVYCINPKQLDRFRDRHTMAGAKDDRRDAFVIAESLCTDAAAYREIKLGDPRLLELRELAHMHDELGQEHRAVASRLYQQVLRIFPQLLELGSIHTDEWLVSLLDRAPTPEEAKRLSLAKIGTILKAHGIRKWTAEQVRELLQKPAVYVADGVTRAAQTHMRMLLPRLKLINEQRHETRKAIEGLLDELEKPSDDANRIEHRDVTILRSLPGVGMYVAATMLSEAREALEQRDYHQLRGLVGVAPVTRQSGKSHKVMMRKACSRRLRTAVFFLAKTIVRYDDRLQALYKTHRARGHSQGHALRVVGDRALAMLMAMLQAGTEYDPSKRTVRLAA